MQSAPPALNLSPVMARSGQAAVVPLCPYWEMSGPGSDTHFGSRRRDSRSGSDRLVVEIVGGVTEVSLHVRYGGISGPRSAPIKQMFEPIGCSLLSRATPSKR